MRKLGPDKLVTKQPAQLTAFSLETIIVLFGENWVNSQLRTKNYTCTTVIFLCFQTGRSGQSVETQIRLLLLHCLSFHLYLLDRFLLERPLFDYQCDNL